MKYELDRKSRKKFLDAVKRGDYTIIRQGKNTDYILAGNDQSFSTELVIGQINKVRIIVREHTTRDTPAETLREIHDNYKGLVSICNTLGLTELPEVHP